MAARPEVAAPVPEGRVGRLVDLAVTHHTSPSVLDGPVRQPLQPTQQCDSKKPIATGHAERTVPTASILQEASGVVFMLS